MTLPSNIPTERTKRVRLETPEDIEKCKRKCLEEEHNGFFEVNEKREYQVIFECFTSNLIQYDSQDLGESRNRAFRNK